MHQIPACLSHGRIGADRFALGLRYVTSKCREGSVRQRPGRRTEVSQPMTATGGLRRCGGDYKCGGPVQASAGLIKSHRGPRVGMGGCFLDIVQRDPGIQRCGDERVSVLLRTVGDGELTWREELEARWNRALDHPHGPPPSRDP